MRISTSRSLSWVPILLALFGLTFSASAQNRAARSYTAQAPAGLAYQTAPRGGPSLLYDQIQTPPQTSATISQDNATRDTLDNFIADDFVIPGGRTWNVTQVFARGFYGNTTGQTPGTCTEADIRFYQNGPGEPGAVIESRTIAPSNDTAGALTFTFDGVTLAAGATAQSTFWVSVQCRGPGLDIGIRSRWNWFDNTNIRGTVSQINNPGGGFGLPPGYNDLSSDRDFSLSGSATGTALFPEFAFSPDPLTGTVVSGGTATAMLTIQNLGAADLTFSFPAFAALNRILALTQQGIDLNRREVAMNNTMPKGVEGYGTPGGTGLQYRVGGPDAFGYTFIDSGEDGGPAFEAIDIAETGTVLTLTGGNDDGEGLVSLPFAFNFYGINYNFATVGANGALILQNDDVIQQITFSNSATMPNPAVPNTLIAVYWDDLNLRETGTITTQTLDDGRYVIQWTNAARFGSAENDAPNTFQVILSSDGGIKTQYLDINAVNNASSTIGIENAAGTQGLLVNANTADYVVDGLAIQFNAPTLFLAGVTPAMGTVAPGASVQVEVALSGTNQAGIPIQTGTYMQGLRVVTNDQDEASVTIPVTLTVTSDTGGDDLEATPNPVVETLASGTTGTETVTLTNNTDQPVPFSFPQYSDGTAARTTRVPQAPYTPERPKGDDSFVGVPRDAGGPDAFGYQWSDSNEPGGPTYNFTDISTTGTPVTLGDDASVSVDLPFAFPFYGEDQTSVRIVSNGFLAFGGTSNTFSNAAIPTAAPPNYLIAGYWDDLNPSTGGSVAYQTLGDGTFVVQYTNVPRFGGSTGAVSFQIILSPTGAIKYQYQAVPTTNDSATIGIENADGTDGLQIAFNTVTRPNYAQPGLAVLIQARPAFVTAVTPPSGTIPANGSVTVDLTFDATGLIAGTYDGSIDVVTPDSTLELGVRLNVTGMPTVTVAPGTLAFGDLIVGNSASLELTITNNGTSTLNVSDITSDNPAFTIGEDDSDLTIAPGQSQTITVTFTPTAVGSVVATLSIVSDASSSPDTVTLTGNALAAPNFTVAPNSLTFTVDAGMVSAPQTLTLSNTGAGVGTFQASAVFVDAARGTDSAAASQTRARVAARAALTERTTAAVTANRGDLTSTLFGTSRAATSGLISHAQRGGIDCAAEPGIIIHDDGTAENGYSGNAAVVDQVTVVDKFTPTESGGVSAVCVAFIGLAGAPTTIPYEIVFFDDDGAGGAPGTELGSQSATATNIPNAAAGAIPVVFQQAEITDVDINIEGSVYIGVRFAPTSPGVFVASDESTGRPVGFAGGYFGTSAAGGPTDLAPTQTAFPDYRSLFVRAVFGATPVDLIVTPESGTVAAGGTEVITVTADATDSEPGTYQAEVRIATDNPANPVLTVPVTIVVRPSTAGEGGLDLPTEVTLYPNFPNPVAQATTIKYALPEAASVAIRVYDVAGRHVATLAQGDETAGFHEVTWNARSVASGVYVVRMQAGTETRTVRLSVVR